MAKVADATTALTGLSWFKISEIGLPSSNPDYWGTEVLNVRYNLRLQVIYTDYF